MNYKVVISYKDMAGRLKEESVLLSAPSQRDAEFQRLVNQEFAEKRYGQANVISVSLVADANRT